ncbi:MAG: ECF-type sigma factor [Planctomycetota bacterium]
MADEITELLNAIESGHEAASERVAALVYGELRELAAAKMAHERRDHTLHATDLVGEAYLRLFGNAVGADDSTHPSSSKEQDSGVEPAIKWQSRRHFFAAAAEAMRRILIDQSRAKKSAKRGGGFQRVEKHDIAIESAQDTIDLVALDEALTRFESVDADRAEVVKLRYFAGLTIEQTAETLGVSTPTVKRHWNYAKAWLRREMEPHGQELA